MSQACSAGTAGCSYQRVRRMCSTSPWSKHEDLSLLEKTTYEEKSGLVRQTSGKLSEVSLSYKCYVKPNNKLLKHC